MHNMSCNYLKVNEQQLELSGRQAPSVHRKIPVYRDLTQIQIPVFVKIKHRYFCTALQTIYCLLSFSPLLRLPEMKV